MDINDPGRIELRVISPEARSAYHMKLFSGVGVVMVAAIPITLATSSVEQSLLVGLLVLVPIVLLLIRSHHMLLTRAPLRWVLVGKDGQTTAFAPDGAVVGTTVDETLALHRVHYVLKLHSPGSHGTSTELRPAIVVRVHEAALIAVCHSLRRPIAGPQVSSPPDCDLNKRTFMRLLEWARTFERGPEEDWRR